MKSGRLYPEGFLVAVDGDQYVGLCSLSRDRAQTDQLHAWITGVRRDYRCGGIALSLKLGGIARAKAAGFRRIRTWNERANRVMLGINERLGSEKYPARIAFARWFQPEEVDS